VDERLADYPKLREQIEELLELVEGPDEEVRRADEVEEQVDKQVRGLGRQTIQSWAETQSARQERAWSRRAGVTRKEKKACGG
jgi:t-SNARE complex subunit (syntaxin)